ncbi:shikimate kinase [Cytophagaceae bacterium ABcell3]|nr:shikimate kinase [Cytophagaceae bacterium ABcell3]
MLIFLIGLPGSGKTTLGKIIANKLNYVFLDTDDLICQQENRSIDEIFDQKGEGYFRSQETAVLNKVVSENEHAVVSTGGGLPCFNNNMEVINSAGKSIFLDVSAEEITRRLLAHNSQNRPMTRGKSPEEVLQFIQHKLKERRRFYAKASFIVSSDNIQVEEIINRLSV